VRQELRLKESKPSAEAFFEWLNTLNVLPKSAMGEAIKYAFNQRPWLMNVYLDGRCELSNNRAENSHRPFVMGRKNWLFCNSQKARKPVPLSILSSKPPSRPCRAFESGPKLEAATKAASIDPGDADDDTDEQEENEE